MSYIMIYLLCQTDRKSDMIKGAKKENGKTKKITIRLTEEEHQALTKKAKKNNMSISEYTRYLLKKEK